MATLIKLKRGLLIRWKETNSILAQQVNPVWQLMFMRQILIFM